MFPAATTISSAANQTFAFGQATTSISEITVTDGLLTPSITAVNDLRIVIATTSVDMRWDTTDTTAVFGGTASGKVSNPVSYAGNGAILIIPVDTNFSANDTLTISGLSYSQFNTITTAATALGVRTEGAGTTTSSSDDKTVTINGGLAMDNHTLGQIDNNFRFPSDNDAELFRFSLAPSGEDADITETVFSLTQVNNIREGDFTNIELYRDLNGDGVLDGGDTAVGGSGVMSLGKRTGTITFSTTFQSTTTQDYILVIATDNVYAGDSMSVDLLPSGVTATGVTSLAALTPSGAVDQVFHARGGRAESGGSRGEVGGGAPDPGGQSEGGGGSGGEGEINPDIGDGLTNRQDFKAPTANGTPNSQWTNGGNAYVSDGAYATAATNAFQHSFGNFGFAVPGNATIQGIEIELEISATTNAGDISVTLSWDGGTSWTSTKTTATASTTDAVYTLGGGADKWGRTWTPAEITDGTFIVDVTANTSSNTLRIDAFQVRVYSQVNESGGGGGGGGEI